MYCTVSYGSIYIYVVLLSSAASFLFFPQCLVHIHQYKTRINPPSETSPTKTSTALGVLLAQRTTTTQPSSPAYLCPS